MQTKMNEPRKARRKGSGADGRNVLLSPRWGWRISPNV